MQAVILAAGEGMRMRPLTEDTSKPMLKVNGKPLLAYTFETLPSEIDEVVLVVGYLQEQIRDYFGDSYQGKKIIYIEQEKMLGTGYALGLCKDVVRDKFLVVMADDIYTKEDLENCLKYDRSVLVKEVTAEDLNGGVFGHLEEDENGNLVDIIERSLDPGEVGLINTAVYVLDKHFFDYELVEIKNQEFGLPQTMAVMAKDYPVKVVRAKAWLSVGTPEQLAKVEGFLKQIGVIK